MSRCAGFASGPMLVLVCCVWASESLAQTRLAQIERRHVPIDLERGRAVALVDVDRDGDADLAIGGDYRTALWINDGDGGFADVPASFSVPSQRTRSIAVGDVDGDGWPDLVYGNTGDLYGGRASVVYLNTRARSFRAVPLPYADHTEAVALADFDGDGDLDLVVGNGSMLAVGKTGSRMPRRNRLYLNAGGSFFEAAFPALVDITLAVATGDVDGDGDVDIVFGNAGQNRLHLNDGRGRFVDATATGLPVQTEASPDIALGDVDGDGSLDLLCAGAQDRLYLNDGSGRFSDVTAARLPVESAWTDAMALVDVDGDRDLDALFTDGAWWRETRSARLWLNDGAGTFTDASALLPRLHGTSTTELATGDLDGDGDVEVVFTNEIPWQTQMFLGVGRGEFVDATRHRLPFIFGMSDAVASGDVDGDGSPDLLFGDSGRGDPDRLLLGDGTGMFTDANGTHFPARAQQGPTFAIALGDIDGDGDVDLVLGNYPIAVFVNLGGGHFGAPQQTITANNAFTSLALADVDGDRDLDLLVGGWRAVSLFRNDGAGRFADSTSTSGLAGLGTGILGVGDFDGDRDVDLILSNGPVRMFRNDGTGRFRDAAKVSNVEPLSVAVGDIDGDRDLDLAIGARNGTSRVVVNDGRGNFMDVTSTRLPGAPPGWSDVAMGDLDEDGDLDLVFTPSIVFANDGRGFFRDETATWGMTVGLGTPFRFVLADIDGDQDLDVVFGPNGWSASSGRVWVNLRRQLHAGHLARIGYPYSLDLHGVPGHVAVPMLSVREVAIDVAPFGTLRLDPNATAVLPSIPIDATWHGSAAYVLPADVALVGATMYLQALLVDPVDPTRSRLSNLWRERIHR